jgi:hypothetical protein
MARKEIDLTELIAKPIQKAVQKAVNRSNMSKDAKLMAREMRIRTRLGKGVDRQGGRLKRLKPIKESTITNRKRTKAKGKLHPHTSPRKSNLTETGKLLDGLDGISPRNGEAKIVMRENRRDGALNADIVQGQEDMGRSFMHLSFGEVKRFQRRIRERVLKLIKANT